MAIENGKFVKVEYTGTYDDGTVFDSTDKTGQPIEFQIGAGMVIDGFEKAVVEMDLNEEKEVTLQPSEAYGEFREELMVDFPRDKIPKDDLEVGQMVILTGPDGMPGQGKIAEK